MKSLMHKDNYNRGIALERQVEEENKTLVKDHSRR